MTFSFLITLFFSILLVTVSKLNPILGTQITSLLKPLYFVSNTILAPITSLRLAKDDSLAFVLNAPALQKENTKLKEENNLLKIKIKQTSQLVNDQNLLRKLSDHTWLIQPVRLVSIDTILTFTAPDFTQIKPGQPIVSGNSLVGLVTSVNPPTIKAISLTHPDVKIAIQLETGIRGSYLYRNNTGATITNLDNSAAFNPQTSVLTLPNDLIPENLIVGRVEKIITSTANPTQEAVISLDKDISSAHDFFIVTKP